VAPSAPLMYPKATAAIALRGGLCVCQCVLPPSTDMGCSLWLWPCELLSRVPHMDMSWFWDWLWDSSGPTIFWSPSGSGSAWVRGRRGRGAEGGGGGKGVVVWLLPLLAAPPV
jgi:hypothetical protein